MNWLKEVADGITSLFFPMICPGCGCDLQSTQDQICISCFHRLPTTEFHRHVSNPVEKIFWGRVPIESACSFLYFTSHSIVQQLMHELKYNGNKEVGVFLGKQLGIALQQSERFGNIDAIIPLPLHPKRQKQRGYNQAEMVADGISAMLNIPVLTRVVARNVETSTQTRNNRRERWENIEGKFTLLDFESIRNRKILLVDDVITTGATLESCAQTLISGAAASISIATLAYTLI